MGRYTNVPFGRATRWRANQLGRLSLFYDLDFVSGGSAFLGFENSNMSVFPHFGQETSFFSKETRIVKILLQEVQYI